MIGVDGDYHEVGDPDASTGGSSGSAGSTTGGSAGSSATGGTAGTSGTGGSGGTGGTSSAECASLGKQCVAAPPADWSGPIALLTGATTPTCTGQYPTAAYQPPLQAELDAGTPSCTCSCAADPAACPDVEIREHGEFSTCGGPGAQIALFGPDECKSFSLKQDLKVTPEEWIPGAGPCIPGVNKQMPSPSWGVAARACAPASQEGTCDGTQTCVPPLPADAELCIFRSGDHACPNGYEKSLFHGDYADARDCAACTCGSPTGVCGGSITLYSDSSCATSIGSGAFDACLGPFQEVRSARYTATTTAVSCSPSAGAVTGSVALEDPVTFCCVP